MRRLAVIAALFVLAAPAGAAAYSPPGERPATGHVVAEAVAIARGFWAERNVRTCEPLRVHVADSLMDGTSWAWARATLGGCDVWLFDGLVNLANHKPRSHWPRSLCRTLTHELGHTAGLPDTNDGGLMDSDDESARSLPWACRVWAKRYRQSYERHHSGRSHHRHRHARKHQTSMERPETASYDQTEWPPADERPGRTPLVDRAVNIGEAFWNDRSVRPCPANELTVRVADDLGEGADGRGEGCVIWLRSALVAMAERLGARSDTAVYLCRVVTHELGHTAGLPDSDGGVMDPASGYREGTPWDCRASRDTF